MDKFVYIVKSDSGQYDEWSWWINGIFTDPIVAENEKQKILDKVKEQRELTCPVDKLKEDEWTDLDYKKWSEWSNLHYEAENFNNCVVVEMELNKIME
jgi:hypothetical protein